MVMACEVEDIVQEVSQLKKRKQHIEQKLLTTALAQKIALQHARTTVAKMNEEYAAKYFAETPHSQSNSLNFSSRIAAATSAMQSEIRKIETKMDLRSMQDEEIEQLLTQLELKEKQLENLKYENTLPFTETQLYASVMAALSSDIKATLEEDVDSLQDSFYVSTVADTCHSASSSIYRPQQQQQRKNSSYRSSIACIARNIRVTETAVAADEALAANSGSTAVVAASSGYLLQSRTGSVISDFTAPTLHRMQSMQRFDDPFGKLIREKEEELQVKKRALDRSLRNMTEQAACNMENAALEQRERIEEERAEYIRQRENMYSALLEGMLNDTQVSCRRISVNKKEVLDSINPQKLNNRNATNNNNSNNSSSRQQQQQQQQQLMMQAESEELTAEEELETMPWKMLVSRRFEELLENDRRCRELESELDQVLAKKIQHSQLEVDAGLEQEYLETIVDSLSRLYIDASHLEMQQRGIGVFTQQQQHLFSSNNNSSSNSSYGSNNRVTM